MSEIVEESDLKNSKKLKTFTLEELVIIGSFIAVTISVLYAYVANFMISYNNYPMTPYFGNTLLPAPVLQWMAYSILLVLFLSVNFYLLFEFIFVEIKNRNVNYSLFQFLIRLVSINIVIFILYVIFPNSGAFVQFGVHISKAYYPSSNSYILYYSYLTNGYSYIIISLFVALLTIGYLAFKFTRIQTRQRNSVTKSIWELLRRNFMVFFLLNFALLLFLFNQANNANYTYLNEIFLLAIGLNLAVLFFKFLFDIKVATLSPKSSMYSLGINVMLFLTVFYQYFDIYRFETTLNFSSAYKYNGYYTRVINYNDAYLLIAIGIVIYLYRNQLAQYGKMLLTKTTYSAKKGWSFTTIVWYKINPISFVLYYMTIRKLNNDDEAVFFAKKFIIIQSKHLKNTLPGALPSTIQSTIQGIFENDIERLKQLFKINNIKTYSNKAILKFVMNTANLIIKDLQKTLQEHLTQELLKEDNDAKNLEVNVEELWQKANKIMVAWQSTFEESESKYKDTLLHQ